MSLVDLLEDGLRVQAVSRRDLQKLRDFYPLVFAMGLESLECESEDALSAGRSSSLGYE